MNYQSLSVVWLASYLGGSAVLVPQVNNLLRLATYKFAGVGNGMVTP